jgi:hypothetical protein
MRSAEEIKERMKDYRNKPHSVACRDGEILYDTGYADALSWVLWDGVVEGEASTHEL